MVPRPHLRPLLTVCLLAGLEWAVSGAPARAQSDPALDPALDSARLLLDLSVLAHDSMAGRAAGSEGNARARAFLRRRMADIGALPVGAGFGHAFVWPRGRGENIVGKVPGLDPEADVIVLTAHHDHLGVVDGQIFNGTDDNASGVAALLEIGRQLVAAPLAHTVVLAFLDAEEQGSWGARAFVGSPPLPLGRIALNVNLDMVARTDGVLWAAGAHHTPALRPILERVAAQAPLELRLGHDRPGAAEGDDWTRSSDHVAFHEKGIPFVYFGVEDHEDYHRPTDDFERVDPGEYVTAVRTILTAIRTIDAALPLASSNAR